jgi:hypothetical protein
VDTFNSGNLRYTWIRFLEKRSPFSDFFSSLEESIIRVLADAPIIESHAGELTPPSKLKMLGVKALGHFGEQFDPTEIARTKYVSSKYSYSRYHAELSWLGVEEVTPREFIQDLGIFIESSPQEFQNMPETWHSDLSKIIQHLIVSLPTLRELIEKMKMVPLKNGQWVSSSQRSLYFADIVPDSAETLKVPNGILIAEIDPRAVSNIARRNLFTSMGARPWTNENVCRSITSIHASFSFLPQTLAREDLVSHLMFLFRTGWTDMPRWTATNANPISLWLSTESGSVRRSDEIYIRSDRAGAVSRCLEQHRDRLPFLHDDYLRLVPQERQQQLREWMIANLGVAEYPRLIATTPSTVVLSEDFRFLLDNSDYLSILLLLIDCWEFYATWIVQDWKLPDRRDCKQLVKEAIGNMSVSCKGGVSARLKDTVLPRHEVVAGIMTSKSLESSLSFIDLPDPENPKWKELGHFGVVVNLGMDYFINCLDILKASGATLEATSELYMQIYHQCNFDLSLVE